MTDVGGVPVVHTGGWGDNGGGWMGMLLVLALLGGGRGFGGWGGGCGAGGFGGFPETRIENRMDFNNLTRGQFDIEKSVLLTGRDNLHAMDRGFCGVNRNIDNVRFENERNTGRIIENATANTRAILDRMCADELRLAYAKIAEQNQALSEARIISAMKPVQPIPAYLQPNPFATYRPEVRERHECPAGFGAT